MYKEMVENIQLDMAGTGILDEVFDSIDSIISDIAENIFDDDTFGFKFGQVGVAQDLEMPDSGCGDAMKIALVRMAIEQAVYENSITEDGVMEVMTSIESDYRKDFMTQNNA